MLCVQKIIGVMKMDEWICDDRRMLDGRIEMYRKVSCMSGQEFESYINELRAKENNKQNEERLQSC